MWYFDIPKLGPSVGFREEEEAAQVRLNVSVAIGVPVEEMPLYKKNKTCFDCAFFSLRTRQVDEFQTALEGLCEKGVAPEVFKTSRVKGGCLEFKELVQTPDQPPQESPPQDSQA